MIHKIANFNICMTKKDNFLKKKMRSGTNVNIEIKIVQAEAFEK